MNVFFIVIPRLIVRKSYVGMFPTSWLEIDASFSIHFSFFFDFRHSSQVSSSFFRCFQTKNDKLTITR